MDQPVDAMIKDLKRRGMLEDTLVSCPEPTSQTLIVASWLAEAIRRPSGINDTPMTLPVCPFSVNVSGPESMSQTFTVRSSLELASRCPWGLNAMLVTAADSRHEPSCFAALSHLHEPRTWA